MTIVGNTVGPQGWGTYSLSRDGYERVADDPGAPEWCPGFVDIHVHGAFGVDFVEGSSADVVEAVERLEELGYEGLLPTTVTAPVDRVRGFLSRLPEHRAILGFHLEGPFLSPKYPGAQPKEFIVEPSAAWEEVLDDPRLRVATIAPEIPGGLSLVRRLASAGVIVSMGHTDATYAQCEAGMAAGVRHATHTFNAMRPLHHREAGTVGFVLDQPGLKAEIIYDRVHVSRPAASVLIRCKGAEGVVAVSDGTMASGLAAGTRLSMWGLSVEVGADSVRLPDGTLAGSSITLADAYRNLREDFGAEVAIRACSLNPRAALGLSSPPRVWIEGGSGRVIRV